MINCCTDCQSYTVNIDDDSFKEHKEDVALRIGSCGYGFDVWVSLHRPPSRVFETIGGKWVEDFGLLKDYLKRGEGRLTHFKWKEDCWISAPRGKSQECD